MVDKAVEVDTVENVAVGDDGARVGEAVGVDTFGIMQSETTEPELARRTRSIQSGTMQAKTTELELARLSG